MKYDDATWHTECDYFPSVSPKEYGGTHIAMFLRWCFTKGWAGKKHLETGAENIHRVIDGTFSATEFFFKHCNGTLTKEDFNEEGNCFVAQYYGDQGLYLSDFKKHFIKVMYLVPESAYDFGAFSAILDERMKSGILTRSKPWWKFW